MTDLEIDRALALAIGWKEEQIRDRGWTAIRHYTKSGHWHWQPFSHRDPAVIWPIAARVDCFPFKDVKGKWHSGFPFQRSAVWRKAGNPCTAVALAVIAAHGESK